MDAVCNASPVIALAKAGLLELLRELFEAVLLPDAVHAEIMAGGADDPVSITLSAASWFTRVTLDPPVSAVAGVQLGAGEAEVIECAFRRPGCQAILDDRAARRSAAALGVPCIGTLGILFEASRRDLLPSFDAAVERVRQAGLYCDERTLAALRELEDGQRDGGQKGQSTT